MTTIREQILQLISSRLAAINGVLEVERDASGDPSQYPSLNIVDDGHSILEGEAARTRYALSVKIEGYVENDDGLDAQTARSSLYNDVIVAMMAEPPMGGLAEEITEGSLTNATATLSSERRLGFVQDFTIQFTTRRGDPSQS